VVVIKLLMSPKRERRGTEGGTEGGRRVNKKAEENEAAEERISRC